MKLEGRVAVVTGGGSGIGAAAALAFAREGARVVVTDVNEAGAKVVLEQIEKAGGQGLALRADVTQAADTQAIVERALATWGRLDLYFANAGSDNVSVWDVGSDPQHPRLMQTVKLPGGGNPWNLQLSPGGKFLFIDIDRITTGTNADFYATGSLLGLQIGEFDGGNANRCGAELFRVAFDDGLLACGKGSQSALMGNQARRGDGRAAREQ